MTQKLSKHHIPFCQILTTLAAATLLTACQQTAPGTEEATQADSLIEAASNSRDFDRVITLSDSLEATNDLPAISANLHRGWAYHKKKEYSTAEEYYRKALNSRVSNDDEEAIHQKAAGYLSDLLYIKHDYEGALRVAVPVIQEIERKQNGTTDAMSLLLASIGRCQMKLGRMNEAGETFEKAYQYHLQAISTDSVGGMLRNAVVHTGNVAIRYLNAKMFSEAQPWLDRTEKLLQQYAAHPNARAAFVKEYQARLNIYHAYVLEELGRSEEAAEAYRAYTASDYAQTDDGRSDACEYLIVAHRYDEAADNLKELDCMMDEWGYKLTLDNIQSYLLPKYRANAGAGRRDSAMVMATRICEALDSALAWQKNSDAAELATIYDTQQKEMKIAQQQADLSQQRMIAALIALGLIIVFFIFYALYRRKTTKRLAEKNALLEIANARAEESSKMKTNFIKQISHEIRTPLNILSGFTQIVTTPGMKLDDATKQDINNKIKENTDRITGLVNKMLELSDASSLTVIERTDDVSAAQIAAQAAEDSGISQTPHVAFSLQIAPEAETLTLHTNLHAATRALTMLLDNAAKFTENPKSRQHTAGETAQETVRLVLDKTDKQVVFAVEDTGIGIPAEEAEHIFDEFVQLDEYYDGTGIGLTIARSLARRLGGDIVLDTSYQAMEGARFVMTLPIG